MCAYVCVYICVCVRVCQGVWQRRAPGRWLLLKLALSASLLALCFWRRLLSWLEHAEQQLHLSRLGSGSLQRGGRTSSEQTPLLEAQAAAKPSMSQGGAGDPGTAAC